MPPQGRRWLWKGAQGADIRGRPLCSGRPADGWGLIGGEFATGAMAVVYLGDAAWSLLCTMKQHL